MTTPIAAVKATKTEGADASAPAARASTGQAARAGEVFASDLARLATPGLNTDPATRVVDYDRVSRGSKSGVLSPAQQFESFVLQSFVESMLPSEDSTSFYGEGTAGAIWKSMLAEKIGAEIAAAGGVGIAELVAKHGRPELAEAKDALATKASADAGASLAKIGAR